MDLLQSLVIAGSIIIGVVAIDRAYEGDGVELNCDYVAQHPAGTIPPSDTCKEKEKENETD